MSACKDALSFARLNNVNSKVIRTDRLSGSYDDGRLGEVGSWELLSFRVLRGVSYSSIVYCLLLHSRQSSQEGLCLV
jgi:hypothetical protein